MLPDERNINVPVMVWRSCAYTVMAVGLLRHFIVYLSSKVMNSSSSSTLLFLLTPSVYVVVVVTSPLGIAYIWGGR